MEKRNGVENNIQSIKEAMEKSQYEKLANDWRQVHNIIWGVPSVAIAIMSGIILVAYQPQPELEGWPRIVALSLGSFLLFALTVELVKKRLLMNALSVRLQELEGQHTEKFPFSTGGLDDLVTKNIKINLDNKDPVYQLFKWDYARETLTYVTFIAALAVAFLAELEFIKYHRFEPWAFAAGIGVIIIAVVIYNIKRQRDKEERKRQGEDRRCKLYINKLIVEGNLFSNLGKHTESIECFDKARDSIECLDKVGKKNLEDANMFNELGKGYEKSNNYEVAIKMYDEALKIRHDDAAALYNRAYCKANKGTYNKEQIKDDLITAIMFNGEFERKAKEDNCLESILSFHFHSR